MILRSLAVWFVLIAAEILHGILRGIFLVPRVGEYTHTSEITDTQTQTQKER